MQINGLNTQYVIHLCTYNLYVNCILQILIPIFAFSLKNDFLKYNPQIFQVVDKQFNQVGGKFLQQMDETMVLSVGKLVHKERFGKLLMRISVKQMRSRIYFLSTAIEFAALIFLVKRTKVQKIQNTDTFSHDSSFALFFELHR